MDVLFLCQKLCIDGFNVFPSTYSKFCIFSYLFVYVTATSLPLLYDIVLMSCKNQRVFSWKKLYLIVGYQNDDTLWNTVPVV